MIDIIRWRYIKNVVNDIVWIFLQHPCNPSRIYFQHFQALRCSWSGICPHWTRQSLVEMTYHHCMKETGNSSGFTTHLDFHHWFKVKIFFHMRNFLKMFFHIASATFMFPQSFTKWHVCSRDFQGFSAKNSPVHPTNPRLLFKMTKQSKQSSRLESSKYLLSHNMNIATLDKQSLRN